ncbi:hypothetical protein PHSC3_000847 [Chlamydiales bacterium STE3]|nr:hypothetical protein PHSC3_000847 [Chlamydiales bacterium STE3]
MKYLRRLASYFLKTLIIFVVLIRTVIFLLKGVWRGKLWQRFKKLVALIYSSLFQFQRALKNYEEEGLDDFFFNSPYNQKALLKIRHLAEGLHSLLPNAADFFYSFIVVVDHPTPENFKLFLQSAIEQSAPHKEILIGFKGRQQENVYAVYRKFSLEHPHLFSDFSFEESSSSSIANQLAEKAKGNYLILANEEGLMRPDMLYRYEQTVRLLQHKGHLIVYGKEARINKRGRVEDTTESTKLESLDLPYLFYNFYHGALLISKNLWQKLEGFDEAYEGAALYDLILRAGKEQCHFVKVPVLLSLIREDRLTEEKQLSDCQAAMHAFKTYLSNSGLSWQVSPGYFWGSLRAEPSLEILPHVHVIIPYKNQKDLTLNAIHHILRQKNVKVVVTAVDNRSEDLSIREEIRKLGCEVLAINEPFNYSRLNNLAVQYSQVGHECDLLFFMNNDVDLEENALLEMCRWIHQPRIGTVGCRLHYPDGLLQCGGVDINLEWPKRYTGWDILQKKLPFQDLDIQRILRISDGVNGASLLIRKALFLEIEGFDEIWYPIAHSDTNLSAKIKNKGLLNFYTPFAYGVHHETVTREVSFMEDYENSAWLDEQYFSAKSLIGA